MDEVSKADLTREGFQVNILECDHHIKSYHHPGWEPKPVINIIDYLSWDVPKILITARIGSQQWTLKSKEDLNKFMNKAVPTFCELI